jgi:sporulation protein YlmC with PRC-barrel domain
MKSLKDYKLNSLDGEIGKVEEFYFDDKHWTIRYLVADTGNWMTSREVLISPHALAEVNKEERFIAVDLTKKQIEQSPSLSSHKPVSRQYEESYYAYYGWPAYWDGPFMWGAYPYITRDHEKMKKTEQPKKQWDPCLRSTRDVTGHHIQAADGEVGHVADFIVDDETWTIRYLVVATKNWWPGKQVMVSSRWIKRVDWIQSKVYVDLSREDIMKSPAYTAESVLTRDYETGLHKHYNRQGYWADVSEVQANSH